MLALHNSVDDPKMFFVFTARRPKSTFSYFEVLLRGEEHTKGEQGKKNKIRKEGS